MIHEECHIYNMSDLFNQSALLRVSGALEKSTAVMKAMQSLVKVPEIQATMMELSKEMMKVSRCIQFYKVPWEHLAHKVSLE